MIYVVCSLFDQAAGIYGRPIFAAAKGAAIRSVSDEINRAAADNTLYTHPGDFNLYFLGTFDDVEGAFALAPKPERIAVGADLKVK